MSHGIFRSAKIKSTCPQTAQPIEKGTTVFYSFLTNQEYSPYSRAYCKALIIKSDYNKAMKFEERLSFANH
jgi:hypothetical protein